MQLPSWSSLSQDFDESHCNPATHLLVHIEDDHLQNDGGDEKKYMKTKLCLNYPDVLDKLLCKQLHNVGMLILKVLNQVSI